MGLPWKHIRTGVTSGMGLIGPVHGGKVSGDAHNVYPLWFGTRLHTVSFTSIQLSWPVCTMEDGMVWM